MNDLYSILTLLLCLTVLALCQSLPTPNFALVIGCLSFIVGFAKLTERTK
jgi:hypothetical protein